MLRGAFGLVYRWISPAARNDKRHFMNLLNQLAEMFKRHDWVWESHLVNRLGTNRDELRKLRESILTEGTDWRFEKNRVEISSAGAKKLEEHFKLASAAVTDAPAPESAPPAPTPPEEKNAPQTEPQEVVLLVWRVFPKNKHIIEAYRKDTDPQKRENILRVKVKDSSRFTRYDNTGKPVELTCRHLQADFYEYTGGLPKRKGRI